MSSNVVSRRSGFTLIELLITVFIISTAMLGVFGLFVLSLRTAQESERRLVGIALANEKMEMVRNLPYVKVGTDGGVPSGAIPQEEEVIRNGVPYTVGVDIRYVDDVFDGQVGGGGEGGCQELSHYPPGQGGAGCQDLCVGQGAVGAHLGHNDSTSYHCDGTPIIGDDQLGSDYKQVRVQVSWNSPNDAPPVLMVGYVTPLGIEGGEEGGTLDFQALDASGAGVVGATVEITNDTLDPAVNLSTQTNSEGRLVLPGLEEASDSYELSVSKAGYTTEQTYDITSTFTPDAEHSHLSIIRGEVTSKTFFIDLLGVLNVETVEEDGSGGLDPVASVAYLLRGFKTIGVDDNGDAVYVVETSAQTDANGDGSHNDLVWDSYDIVIDGDATGYDIKETSELLPIQINPGESVDVQITLVAHTPISLHLTIIDASGGPIDNATVHLTGQGADETLGTGALGQVYFGDLPQNGTYSLEIDAPGFEQLVTDIEVEDTSRSTLEMEAE